MSVERRTLDIYFEVITPQKLEMEAVGSLLKSSNFGEGNNDFSKELLEVLKSLINEPLTSKKDLDWIVGKLKGVREERVVQEEGERVLTNGEKKVMDTYLELVGKGERVRNGRLAKELGVSVRSIGNYWAKIFVKEGVHSKSQLLLKHYEKSR